MKIKMLVAALALVGSMANAHPNTVVSCKSIDVTYTPFYEIEVRPLDPTYPDSYFLDFNVLRSQNNMKTFTVESEGRVESTGEANLPYDNGRLVIEVLTNGYLKGTLFFKNQDHFEELTCKLGELN